MIATKPMDLRARLKEYLDHAFNGEPVIVSRKNNRNVVIVSEQEYNELTKARRNAEYMAKIEKSLKNHEEDDTITFTMEELKAMESDDWEPSERVLEFERRHGIQRNWESIE